MQVDINVTSLTTTCNWILGNIKHAGFYRVNYNEANWIMLIAQLQNNHSFIESTSRAQLIDDSFNLGIAGFIDQLYFFRLTSYVVNEEEPLVFVPLFASFDYVAQMLAPDYFKFEIFKVNKHLNNLV